MTRILACGAFLKNSACLLDTDAPQAPLWSAVHGDLSDPAACMALEQSVQQMLAQAGGADIFIGVAAVADYRAANPAEQKIKKAGETLTLELVRNPDILAEVAALSSHRPFTVGFAAETQDVVHYAQDKRRRKNLDLIAANQVGMAGSGFESEQNALHVLWEGGEKQLPLADKTRLGQQLIALIAERYRAGKGEH